MNRVYYGEFRSLDITESDVLRALDWLDWRSWLPRNANVFLKPNLTWPAHLPGVTTTPAMLQAVVKALRKQTSRITICESDGGYHSFEAEAAFAGHGIPALCESFGARAVNLSREPAEPVMESVGGKPVTVILPGILLHEAEVFLTLPVPKVHVMTGVSLGFKNQWGCNPSTMRLREHPDFDRKIVAINRRLNPKVIFDGTFFLDKAGPMTGEAVRKDCLLAGDTVGAADAVCCAWMGIDPGRIGHLALARREGMLPGSPAEVACNVPIPEYPSRAFRSHRAPLDWISLLGFHNQAAAWLFWESPLASRFRWALRTARSVPVFETFLYGRAGAPPDLESGRGAAHRP